MPLHERTITAAIVRCQADEFIQVERVGLREIGASRGVQPDDLVIDTQRRAAGGEAKHGRGLLRQLFCHHDGSRLSGVGGSAADRQFHVAFGRYVGTRAPPCNSAIASWTAPSAGSASSLMVRL